MGKIVRGREVFSGSSGSATSVMYDDTTNVKTAIDNVNSDLATKNFTYDYSTDIEVDVLNCVQAALTQYGTDKPFTAFWMSLTYNEDGSTKDEANGHVSITSNTSTKISGIYVSALRNKVIAFLYDISSSTMDSITDLSSGNSKIKYISLEHTLGDESDHKPWLELEAQIDSLEIGINYVGVIKAGSHWVFEGRRTTEEYASFIAHCYMNNNEGIATYQITMRAGVWYYSQIAYKSDIDALNTSLSENTLSTEEDINNYYDTVSNDFPEDTFYRRSVNHSVAHSILGGGEYYLEGFKSLHANYEWQRITRYGNNSITTIFMYQRSKINGTWSSWEKNIGESELNERLGAFEYIYLTDPDQTGDHIEYVKSIWETLELNKIYMAKIVSKTTEICLIQKYSDHLYGSIVMFGYDMESTTTVRLFNGEWKNEYNPHKADRTTISYTANNKEEALAYLDNPITIENIGDNYTCYNFLFNDSVGDSPLGGGTTEIFGYTYAGGNYGCQMALKYSQAPMWRNNINGTWSAWRTVANQADVTALQTTVNKLKYVWSSTIKCATWQRLCHVSYGSGGITGTTYMLNIRFTRDGIVVSDTFMITTHHKQWGTIVKISGHAYQNMNYDVRIVADSSGNNYFEIYDDIRGATSSTTQTVTCTLISISTGTVTTYTASTDGTTLPSDFAVAKTMNVKTSSFQSEELDTVKEQALYIVSFDASTGTLVTKSADYTG